MVKIKGNANIVVLAHDDEDGYCSALAAYLKFDTLGIPVDYYYVNYGQKPPLDDFTGKQVYILDFSYPRGVLEQIHAQADFVQVIDHHKSAKEALVGLDYCLFDMEQSGCELAWQYFHDSEPPNLFKYVGDRDMWRFKYRQSKPLGYYLKSRRGLMDLEDWEALLNEERLERAVLDGQALMDHNERRCEKFLRSRNKCMIEVNGHSACFYQEAELIGELGEVVYSHIADLSLSYFMFSDGTVSFSFRTNRPYIDASALARGMGGGGHAQAAGFKLSMVDGFALIQRIINERVLNITIPKEEEK